MLMGLNQLGENPDLIIKRKFRWTFEATTCGGNQIPPYYLKSASRPELTMDETQIDFLNGRMWIPGKATWAEMPVTFIDVAAPDFAPLWGWLSSVYQFDVPASLQMNTKPAEYQGTAYIYLYDGCGNIIEEWTLNNCWPKSYKFGELAYENSEVCTIEVSLRFWNVTYASTCMGSWTRCPCSPC